MELLTFESCMESSKGIDKKLNHYHDILNSFPKTEIGLTPDIYKKTPEFQEAKKQWNFWWKQYQSINSYMAKNFKKELRQYHENKRKAKIKAKTNL